MKSKIYRKLVDGASQILKGHAKVGVDVSKRDIDVCLLGWERKPSSMRFENSIKGFQEMVKWCESQLPDTSFHFCMEQTGPYSYGLGVFLREHGHLVSKVNPRFIKHFAVGEEIQNKTDKVDAAVIAIYAATKQLKNWEIPDENEFLLDDLSKRLNEIQADLQRELNRLEDTYHAGIVQESITLHVQWLKNELERLEQRIQQLLESVPEMGKAVDVLTREPGVGVKTAFRALSHFGWGLEKFEDAQQAAAATGLQPVRAQSGPLMNKTKVSKRGPRQLRADLYMATVAAIQHNPKLREFYQRLVSKGKAKKAAVIACSRKLIMILYGIYKAHLLGRSPIYHGEKLRYTDISGRQKTFKTGKKAEAA